MAKWLTVLFTRFAQCGECRSVKASPARFRVKETDLRLIVRALREYKPMPPLPGCPRPAEQANKWRILANLEMALRGEVPKEWQDDG